MLRTQGVHAMRHGNPTHWAARLPATEYRRVTPYPAAYRGLGQSSLLAENVHRLWQGHRVMHLSLAKTRAKNYRTRLTKIFHTSRATVATPPGPLNVWEVRHERGEGHTPLMARFGGIALRWYRPGPRTDQPKVVVGHRSAGVHRLRAQTGERCGSQEPCDVHPIT